MNHQYYDLAGVEFEKPKTFSFVGLGPKNYDPDHRLWEEVCLNLTFHPEVDASEIEVLVNQGVVILKGFVPTRKMKKIALRCVQKVEGIQKVVNQLNIHHFRPQVSFDDFDTY